MIGVLVVVALVVAAVGFVALPLLRAPERGDVLPEPSERQRRRLELRERRDAAYAALRELELDRSAGKLGEADYETMRALLRAEAVETLRALEQETAQGADGPSPGDPRDEPLTVAAERREPS